VADLKNHFSFSFSRHADLKECPRRYYWRRYGYWNGWKDNASKESTKAWKLKRLSSPQILMGNVLHDAICKDLTHLKGGNDLGTDKALGYIRREIIKGYDQSNELKFLEDKTAVTFTGDYYPSMNRWLKPLDEILEASEALFRNYHASRLRAFLKKNPNRIKSMEVLEDMEVMKVKVYVKLDLLMASNRSSHLVVDFKTGKRSEEHPDQLALYGMFLHEKMSVPLNQIGFQMVYLKEGVDVTEDMPQFTKQDFVRTKERILAEVVEEQGYLIGSTKDNIAKPIEEFPMNKGNACRFCVYRELCDVEKGVLDDGF